MSDSLSKITSPVPQTPVKPSSPKIAKKLEGRAAVEQKQTQKPITSNERVGSYVAASLKMGEGAPLGTVGVAQSTLVLPLTLLGTGVGRNMIGKQKALQLEDPGATKGRTTAGAVADSLGFMALALHKDRNKAPTSESTSPVELSFVS